MRLFNVIFTAVFAVLALVAGLFAAAVVAVTGSILMLIRRFRGSGAPSKSNTPRAQAPRASRSDDVIEITATEVIAEPAER